MRDKLDSEEGKEIYAKLLHSSEAPYSNIKQNLKFRCFILRGLTKVMMECTLIFILRNIMKLGNVLFNPAGFG